METKITDQPLYITFIRYYGQPDEKGQFFDSAKITVMEPPETHANYTDFNTFMTEEAKAPNNKITITRDKITFYDFKLGGAIGKAIRGQGKVSSSDPIFPSTSILGKGYFFDTNLGVLEILIQIQTVKGDLLKLEEDVDSFISSFRLGLPEDLQILQWIRFKNVSNPNNEPVKIPSPPFPFLTLILLSAGTLLLGILFVIFIRRKSNRSILLIVFIVTALIANSLFYFGYTKKLNQNHSQKLTTENRRLLNALEKRISGSLFEKEIKAETVKQIYQDAFALYDQIRLNGTPDEIKTAQTLYKRAYQRYLDLVVKKKK